MVRPRGRSAEIDEMLTIAPPLAVLIMAGMACLESRNIVSTLTCMTRRYSSGFSSTTLPRLPMPTLLSRKSRRPQRSTAASTSRLHSASLVMSPAWAAACAALGLDHLDGALGELRVAIGHQHPACRRAPAGSPPRGRCRCRRPPRRRRTRSRPCRPSRRRPPDPSSLPPEIPAQTYSQPTPGTSPSDGHGSSHSMRKASPAGLM